MALALALKYRPNTFNELISQESVTQTLKLALKNHQIAHAYLFSGLRGSGKTSSARILSRALQCLNQSSQEPCNECSSCLQALEGRHPDIIEMDAASSRKIDDMRQLIDQTRYSPVIGPYKIFIIDEVHMLTKESFNALLKTLEEPPRHVKFILATTDPLKIPATILSRTQNFHFKRIPQRKIFNHLKQILSKEEVMYDEASLDILSRSGDGSLRDTLTLLDQAIAYCDRNIVSSKVTKMLGLVDPEALSNFFDCLQNQDVQGVDRSLALFEEYEADMILNEMILYLKNSIKARAITSTFLLERFLNILADSKILLGMNCDGGFVLTLTALKMQEAFKTYDESIQKSSLNSKMHKSGGIQSNLQAQESIKDSPNPANQDSPGSSNFSLEESLQAGKEKFLQLVDKIFDRNMELGEIFSRSIAFVSWDGESLKWRSQASLEDRIVLTRHYKIIKDLTNKIFGENTKIISLRADSSTPSSPSIQNSSLQSDIPSKVQKQSSLNPSDLTPSSIQELELSNLPSSGATNQKIDGRENPPYGSSKTLSNPELDDPQLQQKDYKEIQEGTIMKKPQIEEKTIQESAAQFYRDHQEVIDSLRRNIPIKEVKRVE